MDTLFFGEIEKQSKAAIKAYMLSRGQHGSKIDSQMKDDKDLKEYNSVQSEEE